MNEDKPDWWQHLVPEGEQGTRLDRYLRRLVPGLTQGPVEKMLRSGLIRLDGAKAKPATRSTHHSSEQVTVAQALLYDAGSKRPGASP